ncbi:MAG: branched-chain amino acid ABC transporter permease [Paludibacteraceae bacterium]|nr:branched-chain amino acid ABC transporter permease [Paludibacteraceae bacterium]
MIWQFIINGLVTGILYSLLAIGFALVYNTTRIFHIAAAGIYVFAAYMFWFFVAKVGLSVILASLVAVILTMLLSLLSEVLVYRPLKNKKASLNVAMIASIGLMTVIINAIAMFFGNETKVVENAILQPIVWGDIIITTPQKYQALIGLAVLVVFMVILQRTNWGLRLRALSADETLFETLGYNTASTRVVVFLVSGAFIALASCLTVYDVGLDPHMGMNVLINAMVAMIIGGVGKFSTCIIGGLSLGVLQSLTVYQFASNWQNAVTFILLLILLFLRPQGIAGYKQRTV